MSFCKFCVNEIWKSAHIVYVEKLRQLCMPTRRAEDGGATGCLAVNLDLRQMPQFFTCPYGALEPFVPRTSGTTITTAERPRQKLQSVATGCNGIRFSAADWYSSRTFGATIGS